MKIWWPWRREKFQSLFDSSHSCQDEDASREYDFALRKQADAHPKNAPGPFYVVNQECITCGAPHTVAPDLMAWDTDSEGVHCHCYFKKQPEDPYELTQAIAALAVSCCGALWYAGDDPEIIKRLRKAGAGQLIVRSR